MGAAGLNSPALGYWTGPWAGSQLNTKEKKRCEDFANVDGDIDGDDDSASSDSTWGMLEIFIFNVV